MEQAIATAETGIRHEGKAAVREYLIEPLSEAGFRKHRNETVEAHKAEIDKLVAALAYMQPDKLEGLAQFLIRTFGKDMVWPKRAQILFHAWNLQTPPPQESSYARSLIASAMGRRARDEGWLVELFQIAKRIGPPPGKYIIAKLKDEARENRRRRARVAEYIERGVASPADQEWLAAWHADLAECTAILENAEARAGEAAA